MKINLILFVLLLLSFGCAKKVQVNQTVVKVRMPASAQNNSIHSLGIRQALLNSLDDIDCYAVVVSWGGNGNCVDSAGVDVLSGVNAAFGSVEDGGILEFSVDSGAGRNFQIIGFSSTLNRCPDIKTITLTEQSDTSRPVLVGSAVTDVEGDQMDLEISVSIDGAQEFQKCSGAPFNWEVADHGIWNNSNWNDAKWAP